MGRPISQAVTSGCAVLCYLYTRVWSTSPRVGHRSGGILVVLHCGMADFEAIEKEACGLCVASIITRI